MATVNFVRRLSLAQRDMLIAHVDGPVRLVVREQRHATQVRNFLLRHRLLLPDPAGTVKPRRTALSEEGRGALALILADCADALVAAGILDLDPGETPIQILRRLKAERAERHAYGAAAPESQHKILRLRNL